MISLRKRKAYFSLFDSSTPCASTSPFSRKIGPQNESDPKANETHVKPSVIKTKLLLNNKYRTKVSINDINYN